MGSNNGMTGSIGSIIHSVERLLGMNGVVNVDSSKWINFGGTGEGSANLGSGNFGENGGWTWKDIYTDDNGDRYAGSAFLECGKPNSENASAAAKQLIDAMFEQGSFGGVDPVSWAFTEGCGEKTQSLNLYWSNCDWTAYSDKKVPIMQMNQEADGVKKYYVAMANVDNNGNLGLWNQAAALKGEVTYYGPGGMTKPLSSTTSGQAPANYNGVETSSHALANISGLAFDNYNEAQKAYYDLVAQHNIKVNNNYSK